ncbi:LytR/AlgR family response regulator transcription factor [Thermodesulfobacteriota bacterium]
MKDVKAIIADDEEPLRRFLRARLSEVWPELIICGEAKNGQQALDLIERHRPEIAFLDIRMPGLTGMKVAEQIVRSCLVVFVTAYDQYAVEAFENEAVDYLLKPVSVNRLRKSVNRLKKKLKTDPGSSEVPAETLNRLLAAFSNKKGRQHLQYVRVQKGDGIRLIPVDEVIYFKASDKYTLVITGDEESLIRKPIKELTKELDPEYFWQIHRGTIVNVRSISRVSRSLTGRGVVRLEHRQETLRVSNRYMHLFRQM